MTNIPDGYGFVAGRSRETAKAILAAAEAAGVDPGLVQTIAGGYLAPEKAVRQYEGKDGLGATDEGEGIEPDEFEHEEPEPQEYELLPEKVELSGDDRPNESWKNADIKNWARDNGVDLGDATNKADMLAAISSADTEEE
jgi:hypothetical protein